MLLDMVSIEYIIRKILADRAITGSIYIDQYKLDVQDMLTAYKYFVLDYIRYGRLNCYGNLTELKLWNT